MTATAGAAVALVADDDAVIRRVLAMLLERQGFRVLTAADGKGALAEAVAGQPRVIFLDARMPDPDGYEVCRLLRTRSLVQPEPVVIMLTAAGQESDRRKAASVGVNEFLTKPFSPSKLAARLQQLTGEAGP